jgi:hypothetical protein
MQTPGSAGHSASDWQVRQAFVVGSQMGFAVVLQSELITHSTHLPDAAQAGVAPFFAAHSVPEEHALHAFLVVSQIGFAAAPLQSAEAPHSAQLPPARHTGAALFRPMHSAAPPQPRQAFVVLSQIGDVASLQSAAVPQATHLPAAHAGVVALSDAHSAPPVQALHILDVESQIGAEAPQDCAVQDCVPSGGRESVCASASTPSTGPSLAASEPSVAASVFGTQEFFWGESSLHRVPLGQSTSLAQ